MCSSYKVPCMAFVPLFTVRLTAPPPALCSASNELLARLTLSIASSAGMYRALSVAATFQFIAPSTRVSLLLMLPPFTLKVSARLELEANECAVWRRRNSREGAEQVLVVAAHRHRGVGQNSRHYFGTHVGPINLQGGSRCLDRNAFLHLAEGQRYVHARDRFGRDCDAYEVERLKSVACHRHRVSSGRQRGKRVFPVGAGLRFPREIAFFVDCSHGCSGNRRLAGVCNDSVDIALQQLTLDLVRDRQRQKHHAGQIRHAQSKLAKTTASKRTSRISLQLGRTSP